MGVFTTASRIIAARAVHRGALAAAGVLEPEAQAIDGGAVDVGVARGGGRQESPPCLHPADSGEVGGGVRAQERQRGPVAFAAVRSEEAQTTGAETPGGGGEAVDGCARPAVALQLLCREAVGGGVGARREEADGSDRGCWCPCACATEVERREHVLTQGAHRISPFLRRVVDWRRKTS